MMITLFVVTALFSGTGLVALAQYLPSNAAACERAGGMLLVTALIGLGFVLSHPPGPVSGTH